MMNAKNSMDIITEIDKIARAWDKLEDNIGDMIDELNKIGNALSSLTSIIEDELYSIIERMDDEE